MLAEFGTGIYYVHEPLGAAHSYASRLTEPATILVADFGGGTTDFSIVRVAEPGSPRRCVPPVSSGIGIAGDRLDYRIRSDGRRAGKGCCSTCSSRWSPGRLQKKKHKHT